MSIVQNVFDEVRRTIHDENPTYRWSDAELMAYTNAAMRQIVSILPDANTVESVQTISNGIARQVLPAGGIKFIKASRNYADDGTTPQGVIRYVEKDALDTYDPDWEYDTTVKADGANFFEHFCHDSREPDVYYLYPAPPTAIKKAAIVYSANPTAVTDVGNTIPLDDEFFNGIVQYVVYRALTKESRESLPDAFRAELWQNFLAALGMQNRADSGISPEANAPPEGD